MFGAIGRFFNSAFRKLWKMLKFILTRELERFMAEMLDFAMDIVKELMTKDINNLDKARLFFDDIKKEAERRGIEYKDSWINKLREDCVLAVKMNF